MVESFDDLMRSFAQKPTALGQRYVSIRPAPSAADAAAFALTSKAVVHGSEEAATYSGPYRPKGRQLKFHDNMELVSQMFRSKVNIATNLDQSNQVSIWMQSGAFCRIKGFCACKNSSKSRSFETAATWSR